MTPTLYAIEDALQQLEVLRSLAIDEGDTDAVKLFDDQIAHYLSREAAKIDSYAGLIRKRDADADALLAEAARLVDRAKRFQADADRLRASALRVMQAFDVKELATQHNTIRRQGNGGLLPIEADSGEIAPEYKRITVTLPLDQWLALVADTCLMCVRSPVESWANAEITSKGRVEPDGERIRAALKSGQQVNGAKLLPRGEHVRVL